MVIGKDYYEIAENLGTLEQFFAVRRYLDGRHTIAEIAQNSGVDKDSVTQIVSAFSELGLLRNAQPVEAIDGSVFAEQIDASCQMWAKQLGHHRLFAGLEAGTMRREVLLGLILETYHYVSAAPRHIATAIANCDDIRLTGLLSDYFSDERSHGELFVDALSRLGIPAEHVSDANPLTGTLSLINNLCAIAASSTLSYIACTSLFEARGADFDEGADSMRRVARVAGYPEEAVEPLLTHMRIDLRAGHVALIDKAMEIAGAVPAHLAHRVVNDLHNLKHSYDQFHDQIVQYYSNIGNHIPRLYVDYFSL